MAGKETTVTPRLFVAAKALIMHKGKALLVRESNNYEVGTQAGKYGEVGGRLTPGETIEECLRREVREEVGLDIEIGNPFFVTEWRPTVRGEQWQVIAIFFECFSQTDAVVLSDDHDDHIWITPARYREYPVMEDIYSMFDAYLSLKSE